MNPEGIIKKNAGWYTIRILATGLSAFVGVIITKRQLSPQDFLQFNLVMNGVTLINSFALAWFIQSIVRFFHSYYYFFQFKKTIWIVSLNFLFISIPVFILWVNRLGIPTSMVWPLIFMFSSGLFTAILSLFQAAHKAKHVAIAEILRSTLLMAGLLLPMTGIVKPEKNYYWLIWTLSASPPLIYFFFQRRILSTIAVVGRPVLDTPVADKAIIARLLRFGLPLTVWVFASFLLLNADKWYVYIANINTGDAANYVALSDLIARATGFAFSPIVTSAYPVISNMHDSGSYSKARALILKVVKWQCIIGALAMAGFLIFHRLIFWMLEIEDNGSIMLLLSIGIILLNILWQTSAMFHKVAELKTNTMQLVVALAIATSIVYAGFYFLPSQTSLLQIFGIAATGFAVYFLITVSLFYSYKWPADYTDETI